MVIGTPRRKQTGAVIVAVRGLLSCFLILIRMSKTMVRMQCPKSL
jgi:hypothetical protein